MLSPAAHPSRRGQVAAPQDEVSACSSSRPVAGTTRIANRQDFRCPELVAPGRSRSKKCCAPPSIVVVQATNAKARCFRPNRFSECEPVHSFEPLTRVIRHNQNTAGSSDVGPRRILPERRPGAIERPGPQADEPQSGLDGDCRRLRAIRDNDPHCLRRVELSRQHSRQLSGAGSLARCSAARSWRTGLTYVNCRPS